jgi:pimeloyl-ACP methyl ester carboxylesterase
MEVNTLQAIRLGGTTQWVRICSTNPANPVLLLMQLGPGLPIINDARSWEQLLALQDDFTVVYWDQRGTGLSLRGAPTPENLAPATMVSDTISLLELLRDRFGAKAFVAGFSFGATFAASAAVERPDLVAALVAVGMDIDVPAGEANAYDFALSTARQRGHRRAIRQLEAIGPPPHQDAKQFNTRVRWLANFGGVTTNTNYNRALRALFVSLLRSPDYSLHDAIRTAHGIRTTQTALLPQLAATNLVHTMPRIDVPIVLVQGRHDAIAPGEATQRFYDAVDAPHKELLWFEQSAHTPHLEEPQRFRNVLKNIRARHIASARAQEAGVDHDR